MMLYWVINPWRSAFDFKGRATRREYWLFLIQLYAAFLLGTIAIGLAIGAAEESAGQAGSVAGGFGVIGLACLAFLAYLSASVRRLHDHDKSGWFFLVTAFPFFGWIFFLIMMLTPGNPYENSYGPDPRERGLSSDETAAIFS